tara:strand:- start:76 stop:642 length:567 start_codon:yes stop_codon:yes gene_type:complete
MSIKNTIDSLGENIVRLARINLGASKSVDGKKRVTNSTGDLSASLDYKVLQKRNDKGQWISGFYLEITSTEDYASFIEQGVKGSESTKPSAKDSPFKFKGQNVARGVMAKWIKNKPIRPQKKGGGFVKKTPSTMNNLAFLLGRAVATKGIGARNYVKDATEMALTNGFAGEIAKEIYIDYIKKTLKTK